MGGWVCRHECQMLTVARDVVSLRAGVTKPLWELRWVCWELNSGYLSNLPLTFLLKGSLITFPALWQNTWETLGKEEFNFTHSSKMQSTMMPCWRRHGGRSVRQCIWGPQAEWQMLVFSSLSLLYSVQDPSLPTLRLSLLTSVAQIRNFQKCQEGCLLGDAISCQSCILTIKISLQEDYMMMNRTQNYIIRANVGRENMLLV